MDDEPSPNTRKSKLGISILILIFLSIVIGEIPNNIKALKCAEEEHVIKQKLISQISISSRISKKLYKKIQHMWKNSCFRICLGLYKKWEKVYQPDDILRLQNRLCHILQEINAPPILI